jgi:hypothetical protein
MDLANEIISSSVGLFDQSASDLLEELHKKLDSNDMSSALQNKMLITFLTQPEQL